MAAPASTTVRSKEKEQAAAVRELPKNSLLVRLAQKYHIDADRMLETLKATAFRQKADAPAVSNEQMMMLLAIADRYGLNPFNREVYAFPSERGIVAIVGIDGFLRMINEHPHFKDMQIDMPAPDEQGIIPWITCTIFRDDRDKPVPITEWYDECKRETGPWRQFPKRMLRHKAIMQAARVVLGFTDVHSEDDAKAIIEGRAEDLKSLPKGKPHTEEPAARADAPAVAVVNSEQLNLIREAISSTGILDRDLLKHFEITSLEELPFDKVQAAFDWIHENQP